MTKPRAAEKKTNQRDTSLVQVLKVENTTAGVVILGPKARLKPSSLFVATNLFDKGIEFVLPKNSCTNGHLLLLDLLIYFNSQFHHFKPSGKIHSISSIGDQQEIVKIEFKRYNKSAWGTFLNSLENKQERVTSLFQAMRGIP